jgi:hypothetical protein
MPQLFLNLYEMMDEMSHPLLYTLGGALLFVIFAFVLIWILLKN